MPPTIWIIAGESSGEAYGAALARELQQAAPDLTLRGMGGNAMRAAGVDLLVDSTELGVVGFVEVVRHLPRFLAIFRRLVRRAETERPDAVVLIDYPGFNLRFARRLHAAGIKVVYYVSPQVWAWGRRRIPEIARMVDKMLVIFPFEPQVYAATGLDVEFVGHPLLEILNAARTPAVARSPNTVLLLPGSRASELGRLLEPMLRTAALLHQRRPDLAFVIATPRDGLAARIQARMGTFRAPEGTLPDIRVETGRTWEWLQRGTVGLAASGTVTIEAAIMGLPLVVAYRLNRLTYWAARLLVKIRFFTMVNLVANRCVYEEFLQDDASPANLARALEAILPGGTRHQEVEAGMAQTVAALGGQGNASRRAAQAVLAVAARTRTSAA